MSFDLKRESSHPSVKTDPYVKADSNVKTDLYSAPGLDDQVMAAAGEKKKGKLAYHRASTACSKSRAQ